MDQRLDRGRAPADEVFNHATDPLKFHERQQGVVSRSMESHGAPAVGDHGLTARRIGGSERPATSELVRLHPPLASAAREIDGPIRAQFDVSVEPLTDQRCRLTIVVDFEGHGIGKVLVPLVCAPASWCRDAWRQREKLKERIEMPPVVA